MMSPHVYAVIPVHNRKHYTQKCLQCFERQTWKELSIIVVDDGSTDGTAEMIFDHFPRVNLLKGNGNLWWAGAINLGISYALKQARNIDYILVINDDLEIEPDYVAHLVRFAQNHPDTLAGSVGVDITAPDRIVYGGVKINWWTAKSRPLNLGKRISEFDTSYSVESSHLTGRGTLIPIHVFKTVGLYDDIHFQQGGDTELPLRAEQAGYNLIVSYSSIVKMHLDGGADINIGDRYQLRDIHRYFFDIKSAMRLRYRYYYALTAANGNPLRFVSFIGFDLARITYHFLKRVTW